MVANISLNASYLYSMRADPYNPACIWWSTDVKVWSSISPMSYGTCQSIGASDTQLQGEKSNWLCNSRSDLLSRLSITLVNVTGGGAGVAYLTVQRSSDSLLVPGWIGMPLQVGVPVNLSTLSTEQTGPNPIFTFDLGNTTGSPTGYTLEYAWLGRGPELCFNGTINNTGLFVFPIEIEETLANGTVITRTGNRTVNILDAGTPGCGVAASAPSAPYNTTLNTADPTSLAFTVPYDGGSPIEYYEYSQDNTTWVRLSEYDMGGNMRSATLSGIVSCIYLRAVNLVGRGAMTKVCKPITTQTSSTTITRSTTSTATTMTRYTTSTSTWAPASSSSCACYSVAYGNNFLTGFCCNGLPPYGKSYPSFNAAMLAMTQYKCSCGGITLASGSYTLRAGSTLMYSGTEVSWLFNGTYTCDCSRTHP